MGRSHLTCRMAGGRKGLVGHAREGRERMRSGRGNRIVAPAALLLAAMLAVPSILAQAPDTGSIEGKLTDLYSKPLGGAVVVVRNARTGAEVDTVTSKNGSYRVAGLAPGIYGLEARTEKFGQGHASGIVVMAGHAVRVQTAIALNGQSVAMASATQTRSHGVPLNAAILPVSSSMQNPVRSTTFSVASVPTSMAVPPPDRPAMSARAVIANPAIPPSGASSAATEAALAAQPLPAIAAAIAIASPTAMNRTGMILSLAAAASAAVALQFQAALPPRIAAEATEPDAAEPNATTLSADELQELPSNGSALQNLALDTPPEPAPIESGERVPPGARLSTGGPPARSDARLAFATRSSGRRETSSLLVPSVTDATVRTLRVFEGNGGIAGRSEIETRSGADHGTGRLHGQAFFFDREGLLNARNPLSEWVKETAPGTATVVPTFTPFAWSPADSRTRWGVGAGGPLRRNKLFWYAMFESERRDDPAISSVKHPDHFFAQPSNDEMQLLSARLSLAGADPVAEGLGAYSKMLETLAGLLGPAPRTSIDETAFARIDWNVTQRHRFTLQGAGSEWDSPGGGLSRASETYGTRSFGHSRGSETWLLARWEAVLTPNLLAVTQAALGRHILSHPAEAPSPFEQSLNVNLWGQLPQMVVDSRYGFTIGNPARFGAGSYPDERSYEGRETVDWMHSSFKLSAGVDLRHDADVTSFVRNHTGTYHYSHVENFASDALVFATFGLGDALDPRSQHNCDQRGKAWRDTNGQLHGLGYLPCYSYYTQTLGPTDWHLQTNDLEGFATAQWRPRKSLVMSAGLRWDREETPPPIALVNNPELPLTGRVPGPGNEWAPRLSLAWGTRESHWPVLRVGYGMYYGRTSNSVLQTALTQTGSPRGDLSLFMRPTDNLASNSGGAPPFPYVLAGSSGTMQKPGAVEVAPTFKNGEVHQAVASLEEDLPARVLLSVTALTSLGRRLPVTSDTNFDPTVNPGTITYMVEDATGKGPIKASQITVPFFASWPSDSGGRLNPDYQHITELLSRANSTYEAGMLRLSRTGRRGLSFNLRYTYAHAMDWNPDEGTLQSRASVFDPLDFRQEYGTSDLDLRHSASAYAIWQAPWKLGGAAGRVTNGWMLSGTGQFHSGRPYTMRTAGSLAQEYENGGPLVVALGPGINGYGGDNRIYGVGRNTYRYPATWKADVRLGKRFALGHEREVEVLAQSFNLFNHQNVTEIETVGYSLETGTTSASIPKLNFLTGLKTGQTEFGQPLNVNATDYYRERQFDFGLRLRFKYEPVD